MKKVQLQLETIARSLNMIKNKNSSILSIEVIPQLCLIDSSISQEKGKILEATFYLLADILNKRFNAAIFEGVQGGQKITDNNFLLNSAETDFGFCQWGFQSDNLKNLTTFYKSLNYQSDYLHLVFILEKDYKSLNKDAQELFQRLNTFLITDSIVEEVRASKTISNQEFIDDIANRLDKAA